MAVKALSARAQMKNAVSGFWCMTVLFFAVEIYRRLPMENKLRTMESMIGTAQAHMSQ